MTSDLTALREEIAALRAEIAGPNAGTHARRRLLEQRLAEATDALNRTLREERRA